MFRQKKGYSDFHRDLMAEIIHARGLKITDCLLEENKLQQLVSTVLKLWSTYKYPMAYVTPEIAELSINTDLEIKIRDEDVRRVLRCYCLVFPRSLELRSNLVMTRPTHAIISHINDGVHMIMCFECGKCLIGSLDLMDKDKDEHLFKFVINILLMMSEYPETVEKFPEKYKPRGQKKAAKRDCMMVRSPLYIKERRVSYIGDSQSTGRSVAMHWRRGHWRKTRHKIDWENQNPDRRSMEDSEGRYHLNWIKPVLVGAKQ